MIIRKNHISRNVFPRNNAKTEGTTLLILSIYMKFVFILLAKFYARNRNICLFYYKYFFYVCFPSLHVGLSAEQVFSRVYILVPCTLANAGEKTLLHIIGILWREKHIDRIWTLKFVTFRVLF